MLGELETGAKAKKPKVAIMMIGEQPGDQEDKQGRPFVGPAGKKLLDKCLEEADIDRRKVYVTNTVKHFRWEPRGKLRIHKKPSMKEIHACIPWLEAELEAIRTSDIFFEEIPAIFNKTSIVCTAIEAKPA
jgi:uracil-DNA glycosylase family 4